MRPLFTRAFILAPALAVAGAMLLASQGPARAAAAGDPLLNIFYLGKRRGQIEPCGCKTAGQAGIAYEYPLYGKLGEGLPGLRLDAGEWMERSSSTSPVAATQTEVLLEAMMAMDYDVINVAAADLAFTPRWFDRVTSETPGLGERFVSANIFRADAPERHAFSPVRRLERTLAGGRKVSVAVIGATSFDQLLTGAIPAGQGAAKTLETNGFIVRDAIAPVQALARDLEGKVDLLILLYAGDFNQSMTIARDFPQFDYIISTAAPVDNVSTHFPVDGTNLLLTLDTTGRRLGSFAIRPREGSWEFAARPRMIDVAIDVAPEPAMQALVDEFHKLTDAPPELRRAAGQRQPPVYAGAHRCIACHEPIYREWKESPHGRAMQSLIESGRQFEPEALRRSVTGYGEANGFRHPSQLASKLMTAVQCESCHGPSMEHATMEMRLARSQQLTKPDLEALQEQVKAKRPPAKVAESTCLECHSPEQDADFNFARDYPLVVHQAAAEKAPAAAAAAAQ